MEYKSVVGTRLQADQLDYDEVAAIQTKEITNKEVAQTSATPSLIQSIIRPGSAAPQSLFQCFSPLWSVFSFGKKDATIIEQERVALLQNVDSDDETDDITDDKMRQLEVDVEEDENYTRKQQQRLAYSIPEATPPTAHDEIEEIVIQNRIKFELNRRVEPTVLDTEGAFQAFLNSQSIKTLDNSDSTTAHDGDNKTAAVVDSPATTDSTTTTTVLSNVTFQSALDNTAVHNSRQQQQQQQRVIDPYSDDEAGSAPAFQNDDEDVDISEGEEEDFDLLDQLLQSNQHHDDEDNTNSNTANNNDDADVDAETAEADADADTVSEEGQVDANEEFSSTTF